MESSTFNEGELLDDKLEKVAVGYCDILFGEEEQCQALLQVLQNNDCRKIISKCVDGCQLSNAFVWAGYHNHFDILQTFLDQGMNVDIKNEFENTALIVASTRDHEESFRLLSHHSANVDIQGYNGWTALMYASINRDKEIVELLLDHNPDIDLKRYHDLKTAFDLASSEEIKEMIRNHVNTSYVLK